MSQTKLLKNTECKTGGLITRRHTKMKLSEMSLKSWGNGGEELFLWGDLALLGIWDAQREALLFV